MNYKKIEKIASVIEEELGLAPIIDERVEEEKETTPVPEPALEASDEDVTAYLTAMENEVREEANIKAAEKLVKASQKLYAMKGELTASQKKKLKAFLQGIHKDLMIAAAPGDEEGEEELSRQDVVKELNRKFNRDGKLLVKIDWKKTGKITKDTKLKDLTLDDLRTLLTCVRG